MARQGARVCRRGGRSRYRACLAAQKSLTQKRAQGLPGDNLDDAADDVGGMAVIPGRSRLIEQRQLGELQRQIRRVVRSRQASWRCRIGANKLRLTVKTLHGRNAGEKVCQPGCVPQQVLDGDRPARPRPIRACRLFTTPTLGSANSGTNFANRVADEQLSFLDQHHERDRDDRLGHRIDAEDGVAAQRRPVGPSAPTSLPIGDFAAPGDHHGNAGHVARIDFALHHGGRVARGRRR